MYFIDLYNFICTVLSTFHGKILDKCILGMDGVFELDPKVFGVKHDNSRHFVIIFIFIKIRVRYAEIKGF